MLRNSSDIGVTGLPTTSLPAVMLIAAPNEGLSLLLMKRQMTSSIVWAPKGTLPVSGTIFASSLLSLPGLESRDENRSLRETEHRIQARVAELDLAEVARAPVGFHRAAGQLA